MHKLPRSHPIQQHWQSGLTGLAGKTENAIVNVEQTGANDYWGMLQTYSLSEVMKSRIQDLEIMFMEVMKHERKSGKQTSIVYIMDLGNLKYDKRLLTLMTGPLKLISQFMADHYVELIKYFVIINAPSFIFNLWRIIRPLLPERTKNKVRILGDNWREEILEYADPSALPDFWNVDGQSIFTAKLLRGVKFDENEYFKGDIDKDCKQLQVPAGKIEYISVPAEAGATLKWTIHADGELGFGVFRAENEEETDESLMEMVYPHFSRMAGPTTAPLEDSFVCPKAGVYKIWISNQQAWWHTLKIHYKVSVGNAV
uniref:CRAL-TRIO domain-containing protein n=1 Tax=Plectus sambesii TaxID=2011161 RepID=A0A914XH98_9BILA